MRNFQKIMFVTGLETIWKADIMFETNPHISLQSKDVLKYLLKDKQSSTCQHTHVIHLIWSERKYK